MNIFEYLNIKVFFIFIRIFVRIKILIQIYSDIYSCQNILYNYIWIFILDTDIFGYSFVLKSTRMSHSALDNLGKKPKKILRKTCKNTPQITSSQRQNHFVQLCRALRATNQHQATALICIQFSKLNKKLNILAISNRWLKKKRSMENWNLKGQLKWNDTMNGQCFGQFWSYKTKLLLIYSLLISSVLNPIFAKLRSVIKGPIVSYISHILARGVSQKD